MSMFVLIPVGEQKLAITGCMTINLILPSVIAMQIIGVNFALMIITWQIQTLEIANGIITMNFVIFKLIAMGVCIAKL